MALSAPSAPVARSEVSAACGTRGSCDPRGTGASTGLTGLSALGRRAQTHLTRQVEVGSAYLVAHRVAHQVRGSEVGRGRDGWRRRGRPASWRPSTG